MNAHMGTGTVLARNFKVSNRYPEELLWFRQQDA